MTVHVQAGHGTIPSRALYTISVYAHYIERDKIRTSNNRLRLRLCDNLLIPLLPPYLIIILHASWLVRFRLLRSQSKIVTISVKNPQPHG
jgi:hypothetical protein